MRFRHYFNSFKFNKTHGYILAVEAVFILIMVVLLLFFGGMLEQKAMELSNGKTTEQIQQMLLSDQAFAETFLSQMQGLVVWFVVAAVVILLGGLLLFSLSRKLIWGKLNHQCFDKNTYWKWNLLNIVLALPLFIYILLFGIIKSIFGYLIALMQSQIVLNAFNNLINLAGVILFSTFIFLTYYSFHSSYKVWESIGKAFEIYKNRWKRLRTVLAFCFGTALLLSLILWPLTYLFRYQETLLIIINLVISLLFIVWMRVYIYKAVE